MLLRRARRSLSAVLVATLGASALAQSDQRPPVFRGGVELFQLEVSVLDRKRQPIRGLTADDFTLFEDGKPQRVVQFSEIELPERDAETPTADEFVAPDLTSPQFIDRRLIAIVLDDFGIPFGGQGGVTANNLYIPETKSVAKQIVQSLGPKDFAAVVLSRDPRAYPDFTNMTSKLSGAIDQFRPPGETEALSLIQSTGGRIGALSAMREIIGYFDRMPQRRKILIYIGLPPSVDFARRRMSSTADRIEDLIRAAQASGISIVGFDVGGPIDRSGQGLLLALAENTGGSAFGYSALNEGVRQVFAENHAYYLLGFEPAGVRDGRTRKLEVKVRRNDVTLRYRRSYVAPKAPDMVQAAPRFDAGVDAAVTALSKAIDTRRSFTSASLQPGVITIVTELSAREYGNPVWRDGADVEARVTDASGAVIGIVQGRIDRGLKAVSIPFPLKDAAGQDIPVSRGPFRTSVRIRAGGIAVEDAVQVSAGGRYLGPATVLRGQAAARAALQPAAEFRFSRSERIIVQWIALQPTDRREIRLLRRTGESTGFSPPLTDSDAGGVRTVVTGFPLGQLAPGEYVLEVTVGRGEDSERRLMPLRVVQ